MKRCLSLWIYAWLWKIQWKVITWKRKKKEDLYSHLIIEHIADADYAHAKRVCKDFEIKNLGEYHDIRTMILQNFF